MEVLKQPQYSPVTVEKQVALIYLGTNNLLKDIPVERVKDFETLLYTELDQKHPEILENFRKGKLDDAVLAILKKMAGEMKLK